MTVLIEGERIRAVFPDGTEAVPEGANRFDVQGRFLLPGLIDFHVHLMFARQNGPQAMYAELEHQFYGRVVAMPDMAGDARILAHAQRSTRICTPTGRGWTRPP